MTVILLVRHGMCDAVGRSIAGRAPGVRLNEAGAAQARELADALADLSLAAVYSSPLERAVETARAIAERQGLEPQVHEGLVEIDFGAWTGRTLEELATDPTWRAFNEQREATRIPGGERMDEVMRRAAGALDEIRNAHPEGIVAAVSHCDVIRGLLAGYLGMTLDHVLRLEVGPSSVATVELGQGWVRVLAMNWTPGPPV